MTVKTIMSDKNFIINPTLLDYTNANEKGIPFYDDIDMYDETECIYYWYDHLTRGTYPFIYIEVSLKTKDWKTFSEYYYNRIKHHCTLPESIAIFIKGKSTLLGHLRLDESTFQLIDYDEYECG